MQAPSVWTPNPEVAGPFSDMRNLIRGAWPPEQWTERTSNYMMSWNWYSPEIPTIFSTSSKLILRHPLFPALRWARKWLIWVRKNEGFPMDIFPRQKAYATTSSRAITARPLNPCMCGCVDDCYHYLITAENDQPSTKQAVLASTLTALFLFPHLVYD